MRKSVTAGLPSNRRIIMVKGYQGWAGRAIEALEALQACQELLSGYEIIVYAASPATVQRVKELQASTGLRIRVLPRSPHGEVVNLFGRSRLAIGINDTDGVPNAMLEAMTMGAFPIQSDTQSTTEWIHNEENGLLVDPSQPSGISAAIRRGLQDDALVDRAAEFNLQLVLKRLDLGVVKPRSHTHVPRYRSGARRRLNMKIVLVSLARRGGMLHFQVELANGLARLVPTAVVMSAAAPVSYVASAVHKSVVPAGKGTLGSIASALNPALWYALWKGIAASQPDLVHITGSHAWNPLVAAFSRLQGKPLLYTVHDPEEHSGAPASIRLSNRITTRMANSLVVLTEHGRQVLLSRGVAAGRVRAIPHGVYSFFRTWRDNNIRARKIILYFGRFEPYKGLETLVQAFGKIRHDLPGWRLLLAGNGRLPAALDGARLPEVEILSGYVPDEQVAGLMQRAGMVVLPYTTASQSGVIATAYAFGRPGDRDIGRRLGRNGREWKDRAACASQQRRCPGAGDQVSCEGSEPVGGGWAGRGTCWGEKS